ncbi:MAG: peptidoglycan DD-metalloendopeptidase family protein [Anaerolineales bacterium]|nr:peptidoglycan DD-metalloendopeptidase family protein [Anaerolineales bacterium]
MTPFRPAPTGRILLLLAFLLAACVPGGTAAPAPESSATPSVTALPTATPTPTAQGVLINGESPPLPLHNPTPVGGAPCGYIDALDFPLSPPNGSGAILGQPFGNFRGAERGYHAGEDWYAAGGSSLGEAVHSIGHGLVTYAQPNGWGPDLGTIVVRHDFPGEVSFYSFYGHLEPSSVTVQAGECVLRGEQIGTIGRPRSGPHLHFEIRTQMPEQPGPGYWPVDPLRAGWLPPTQMLYATRLRLTPGVLWALPVPGEAAFGLGIFEDALLLVWDDRLQAVSVQDGTALWSTPLPASVVNAALDRRSAQAYTLDWSGNIQAWPLAAATEPLWETDAGVFSSAALIPLSGGGVAAADRRQMTAVDTDGSILWRAETAAPVVSWVYAGDGMHFATSSPYTPLWSVEAGGAHAWDWPAGGRLASAGDQVYLYSGDRLYLLDVEGQTAVWALPLSPGVHSRGALVALPDESLLLVHADSADRRLLHITSAGLVAWERSLGGLPGDEARLASVGGQPYLLLIAHGAQQSTATLYAIALQTATLTPVFSAGSQDGGAAGSWILALEPDRLAIRLGGSPLAMLNPLAALSPGVDP